MMSIPTSFKRAGLVAAIALALPAFALAADDASKNSALDRVLGVTAQSEETDGIPEVRAAALRELGLALGIRAGLVDHSKKIVADIDSKKTDLDRQFNFGSLTFASGALPPVLEESKDVISVMDYSMRIAGKVYRIVSPVRFYQANWRDYLFLGLMDKDPVVTEGQRKVYPRNDKENAYWKKVVLEGYSMGAEQARKIFALNLARLERDFYGMRRYYELYERGLVSAPEIVTATVAVSRPDPNTLIIGESVIRVTSQPAMQGDGEQWKAKQ